MSKILRSVLLLSLILLLCSGASAQRNVSKKLGPSQVKIVDIAWAISPKLVSGYVLGEANTILSDAKADFGEYIWYGMGISLECFYLPKQIARANLEFAWKTLPGDGSDLKMTSYSLGWLYRFRPQAKRSIYFHSEFGWVSAIIPVDKGIDYELGTHFYIRAGLGIFQYTPSILSIRAEGYYRFVFSKGSYESRFLDDFNAQGVGLDLYFSIPVSQR